MLYLIQWGDNMAYSSNFQKGLMMGLAMGGLSVSKKAEIIEVEKPVYIDRLISSPMLQATIGFVSTALSVYEEVKNT